LSFGGIAAVICLIARTFMRSQAIRFLSLWCLIMLGLIVPALVFTSQDAALDRVTGQAGQIQEKQQSHLKGAL
jgi:diacylglycerol kinase